jgi:hypothetical protein
MKAECGKTARSVCAADGGKPFTGRLLRPDRDEGAVMALDRRGVVIRLYAADNPKGDDRHE